MLDCNDAIWIRLSLRIRTHSVGCVLGFSEKASVGLIAIPCAAARFPPSVTTSSEAHWALAKVVPPGGTVT